MHIYVIQVQIIHFNLIRKVSSIYISNKSMLFWILVYEDIHVVMDLYVPDNIDLYTKNI